MLQPKKMMHIAVCEGEVGRYAFLPGSVERVEKIAARFDNSRKLAHHREHLTYVGTLCGEEVCVTSTGIGGPSAGIACEELYQCGVHTMMRIGSCTALASCVNSESIIIPKGAVRMEGTGTHYMPIEFPAVPDYASFKALKEAAQELGQSFNTGITISRDSFYTEILSEKRPVYPELKWKWEAYQKGGATSSSMECSLLFLAGMSLGIRMSSVLYCTNSNLANRESDAISVGIEAMKKLIVADRKAAAEQKAEGGNT